MHKFAYQILFSISASTIVIAFSLAVPLARLHFIARMFHYAATFRYRINTMLIALLQSTTTCVITFLRSPISGVITLRGNCARMTVANKGNDPAATIRSSCLILENCNGRKTRLRTTIPAITSRPDRQLVLISRDPWREGARAPRSPFFLPPPPPALSPRSHA